MIGSRSSGWPNSLCFAIEQLTHHERWVRRQQRRKLKAAVRTLRRLQRRADEQFSDAEAFDYAFDAGEFSGPSLANAELAEHERLRALVASRYGVCETALEDELQSVEHDELDHWLDSLGERGDD